MTSPVTHEGFLLPGNALPLHGVLGGRMWNKDASSRLKLGRTLESVSKMMSVCGFGTRKGLT